MGYLRLTGGEWRGRKIITPSGAKVRPMQDFLRKAVFDILRGKERGAMIADIFAGSGSLGLEAMSRRARGVLFVEKDRWIRNVLQRNITICGIEDKSVVLGRDFLRIQSFPDTFLSPDIVFLDPPFAFDHRKILQALELHMGVFERALVVYRFPRQFEPYVNEEVLRVHMLRRYGESLIAFGTLEKNTTEKVSRT